MEGLDYWVWIAAGIILALLEIIMPTFFALLFGASAVVVGIVTLLSQDISLQAQLISWAVLGAVVTVLWFKVFRPSKAPALSHVAVVGQLGMVIEDISPSRPGKIRFTIPVLGEPEWKATASTTIATGERVTVIDIAIESHTLVVDVINQ